MNEITAKRALLELCLGLEDKHAVWAEQRIEKRMKADVDWTGIVVKRFIDKEVKKELESKGYGVFITDSDYLEKQFPAVKS